MNPATRQNESTLAVSGTSSTVVQSRTTTPDIAPTQTRSPTRAILRLRGAHASNRPSVQWREDVVDNEGLGRKKSKVCCIYHAPKAVGESSDESSSDSSSSSSDSDSDRDDAGKAQGGHKGGDNGDSSEKGKRRHNPQCDKHGRGRGRRARKDVDGRGGRLPSPNAYEKIPKPKWGGSGSGREKGERAGSPSTRR